MRKIETALIEALKARKPFRQANTHTTQTPYQTVVYLHDNPIVTLHYGDEGQLRHAGFWHCGRPGPTTMSRLNAIAQGLNIPLSFGVRRGVPEYEHRPTGVRPPFDRTADYFFQ